MIQNKIGPVSPCSFGHLPRFVLLGDAAALFDRDTLGVCKHALVLTLSGALLPSTPAAPQVGTSTISQIALTSNPGSDNIYAIADDVEATVTFSAAVDISGTPQLELDFGGTPKTADCQANTNTTTMVCSYTVAENDSAPDGVAIKANRLSGGTISEAGTTDADHKVDGIRPTLITISPDEPQTSADGTMVILTFSENIKSVTFTRITIESQRRCPGEADGGHCRTQAPHHPVDGRDRSGQEPHRHDRRPRRRHRRRR